MDRVLLIDLANAIWRASIGFAPKKPILAPPKDNWEMYGGEEPTPEPKKVDDSFIIIFNFFRNLRPIIEQFSPDKCFAVLEGHPGFRHALFPGYKANRIIKQASQQESRDKFNTAHPEIVRLLQYLPITLAHASDYEADDTISSLAENMKEEDITILSSDGDYKQLLQKNFNRLKVYNPIKKVFMESPTHHYILFSSLTGDKSDGIKRLVSDKKALQFCNDPALFKNWMSIEENRANFSINRSLKEFAKVPEDEIVIQEGVRNFVGLKKEFARMEFQSIISEKSWEKYTNTFDCLRY